MPPFCSFELEEAPAFPAPLVSRPEAVFAALEEKAKSSASNKNHSQLQRCDSSSQIDLINHHKIQVAKPSRLTTTRTVSKCEPTNGTAASEITTKYRAYIDQICAMAVQNAPGVEFYHFQDEIYDLWSKVQDEEEFMEQPPHLCQACDEYSRQKNFSSEFLYYSFLDMLLNASKCRLCWLIFKYSYVQETIRRGPNGDFYWFSANAIKFIKSSRRITIEFDCQENLNCRWKFETDEIFNSNVGIAYAQGELIMRTNNRIHGSQLAYLDIDGGDFSRKGVPNTIPKLKHIPEDPTSDLSMATTKAWITDCVSTHNECQRPTDHRLPTRVLDIASRKEPFLTEVKSNGLYITLSYCWGSSPQNLPPKTTCRNLESRQRQLPMAALPLLFQDAIYIARSLQIKYIWIDSLCIVQKVDDHDCKLHRTEWQKEGVKMAEYYGKAFLTISSLSSKNCNEGFLRERIKPYVDLGLGGLKIGAPPPRWNDIFLKSVLQQRGWVLQERLLSRRILHYSKDETLWECQKLSRREGQTESIKSVSYSGGIEGVGLKQITSPNQNWEEENYHWGFIVANYVSKALSFRADRLVAISGIAELLRSRRSGEMAITYMAGHWKEEPHLLLWETGSSDLVQEVSPVESYIAPSWSWASVDIPVLRHPDALEPENPALDVEISDFLIPKGKTGWASGFNVMGSIPFGSCLTIKAFTKEVFLSRSHFQGDFVLYGMDGRDFGDARLPDRHSSKILHKISNIRSVYFQKEKIVPVGTITCRAARIIANPFYERLKSNHSAAFLLLARQRDLYPPTEVKMNADITHEEVGEQTLPELWVRVGCGTTWGEDPLFDPLGLGLFAGCEKEEIVLI